MYEDEFTKANRMIGLAWSNKREMELWFGYLDARQCLLGIKSFFFLIHLILQISIVLLYLSSIRVINFFNCQVS
jgi:hypothetical protein